jgi:hypothetical protein
MSITILDESKSRILSPIDLDQMTDRYKTSSGLFVFPSPDLWTIEKHLFYLLRNSTLVLFNQKYKYKPDYMSYDEYGTVQLAQLLMYVNNVQCIEDFNLINVVIPTMSAIVDICQDKFPTKDIGNLQEVNF